MTWWLRLWRRNRLEQDLARELQFHIAERVATLKSTGLTEDEARRKVRQEFGGVEQVKEECRYARGTLWVESTVQDLRLGVREFLKTPGFTAVAILTLALGIGANTAIFSLLDGLVLRDLPAPHPEQLVRVGAQTPGDSFAGLSVPMYEEIARSQKVFSGMFAWSGDVVLNVKANDGLSRSDIWGVSGHFYSELGAVPELGRLLGPQDVDLRTTAPARVAVLGYGFWQRHYGGAPDAAGKTIQIEGVPFTVVGVTQQGFMGIAADLPPEVIIPVTAMPLISGKSEYKNICGAPTGEGWKQRGGLGRESRSTRRGDNSKRSGRPFVT